MPVSLLRFLPRLLLVACAVFLAQCESLPVSGALRMNEIQVVGSHNSYKQAIDSGLLAQLSAEDPKMAAGLDYSHLPLERQLDLGLRQLELDVFVDPEGGRFADPLGVRMLQDASPFDVAGVMHTPGFKVFHVQDIDFRSHCLLLVDCLFKLRSWSEDNPGHLPVMVLINAKDGVIDRPGFARPLKYGDKAWRELDAVLRESMGGHLLVPDDVRGSHATLREAVMDGWPHLRDVLGRFLFVLDDSSAKKQSYMKGYPSLEGRAMFVDAPEDTPEASIRVVNNPLARSAYITDLVRAGFIVRTRADADTVEARTGDTARFRAALESGAQMISTDYYVRDERFGAEYLVQLPGGMRARCNPVLTAGRCETQ